MFSHIIISHAKTAEIAHTRRKRIEFLKEGEKKSTQEPCSNGSYLSSANDWQVKVGLNRGMKIPSSITVKKAQINWE